MIVTNQDTLLQLRLEQERKEKKKQKEKVRECINPSITIGDPHLHSHLTILANTGDRLQGRFFLC